MSSRHLLVPPMTRATVEADLESCQQRVLGFSNYCDELVQSVELAAQQLQKKKGRRKVNAPALVFPPRPSGRESLNITNLLGDTLMGAGGRVGLAPINSEDETGSPTVRTTLGNRTRRTAALKARDGCIVAFKPINKKLRRPTDFDPRSGPSLPPDTTVRRALDLSQVQQDHGGLETYDAEDIFKKPALPIPAADTRRAERSSRSREPRITTSSRGRNGQVANDEEEPEETAARPSRATRNKTMIIQNVSETESSEEEAALRPSRSTRARTKAQPNETFQLPAPEYSKEEEAAPRPSRSTRARTKAQPNETFHLPAPGQVSVHLAETTEEETTSRPARATRTRTKARRDDPAIVTNEDLFTTAEEAGSRPTRSIRTLAKENDETPGVNPSASPLPTKPARATRTLNKGQQEVIDLTIVLPKGSAQPASKSGESSKAAQQPRSTYVVSKDNAPGSEEDVILDQTTAERMEVDGSEDDRRPLSNDLNQPQSNTETQDGPLLNATTVLRKWLPNVANDPMETLDFPDEVSPEKEDKRGSFKRHNEESGGGPAVKRVRSVEELSLEAPPNDSGARAPRTRSKARNVATAPADSSRSGASNKENAVVLPINQIMKGLSAEKSSNRTPGKLASKTNTQIPRKDKDDGLRKKEEEALKKKQELMNQKKEEIRKNRETKVKKVAESRAAVEKDKKLQLEREKKEREEKERQAMAELHRKREEEILKKKMLNQQKAQEAEERRIREEKIRLARLKEQEEEQRRAAEARQRQVEEAERLAALRKAQEKEDEQQRALEKEKKEREKLRVARAVPAKDDPDDIGIDEADGDETVPRRPNAKWAEADELNAVLKLQSYYFKGGVDVHPFFETAPSTPNLKEIFGNDALPRPRTSSQFWPKTPPHPESNSVE